MVLSWTSNTIKGLPASEMATVGAGVGPTPYWVIESGRIGEGA